MDKRQLRILFLHGLESGPGGRKAQFLQHHYPSAYTPHMRHPFLVLPAVNTAVAALQSYQPQLLVASSYGAFIAMLLMQLGIWRGPALLLAQAMGIIFPRDRLWIPRTTLACTLVHGSRDETCPLATSQAIQSRAAAEGDGDRVRLLEVDEGHSLNRTMIEQAGLLAVIDEIMARAERRKEGWRHLVGGTDSLPEASYIASAGRGKLLLRCALALFVSATRRLSAGKRL